MRFSVGYKNKCENGNNLSRKCVNVNVGCSATNFVINWSSCHCHLTPIQTGTLQLQHQSWSSLFERFIRKDCLLLSNKNANNFSHLGKAKPLRTTSFGVLEFGPIRDVMFSLHIRLQPVLELTTQNQQQLWKSYFCFKTIHSGFCTTDENLRSRTSLKKECHA